MSTSRRIATGLIALIGTAFLAPTVAFAVPPGGARADTPGTAASVSPQLLAPGQDISFEVTGFPVGETIHIKIDDGDGYSDTTAAGSGVVHQQAIDASGTVKGSFRLPETIAAGDHWLRFLASEPIVDAAGKQAGVKGFTLRAGSDFTVAPTAEIEAAADAPRPKVSAAAAQPDSADEVPPVVWIAIAAGAVVLGIGGGILMARRGRRPASAPEQ